MNRAGRDLVILAFTLVVIMLGFGMIIPIMPFYVTSFGAHASTLGALMATYGAMQFVCAPIWGELSDRYGRKRMLMLGTLGNALSQIVFGLSTQVWMLFVARALGGILSSATLPTAMACIGDSTDDKDRSRGMGLLGAAMGVGMILGPGLGGWLSAKSLSLPFFVAAALSVVAFGLVLFVLPETLPVEQRNHQTGRLKGLQVGELWRALWGPLGFLLLLAFLLSFGLSNFEGVFGLYAQARYGYGPEQVGSLLVLVGVISAIMQGGLIGILTKRWGEVSIIRAALVGTALGFVLMLQSRSLPSILLTVGFFVTSHALLSPTVSSLIS
jgi:MFS transporter, DHA1 family, multidrug resistance protein